MKSSFWKRWTTLDKNSIPMSSSTVEVNSWYTKNYEEILHKFWQGLNIGNTDTSFIHLLNTTVSLSFHWKITIYTHSVKIFSYKGHKIRAVFQDTKGFSYLESTWSWKDNQIEQGQGCLVMLLLLFKQMMLIFMCIRLQSLTNRRAALIGLRKARKEKKCLYIERKFTFQHAGLPVKQWRDLVKATGSNNIFTTIVNWS